MKPLLLVTGPPATRSGYGAHTRDLIHSLIIDNSGFDLITGTPPYFPSSQGGMPNDIQVIKKIKHFCIDSYFLIIFQHYTKLYYSIII